MNDKSSPTSHLSHEKNTPPAETETLQNSRIRDEKTPKASVDTRPRQKRVRRNALKHGLSVPVSTLPYFKDQIDSWHEALLNDIAQRSCINDEIRSLCYEIAIQKCELSRIADMKKILSSHRLGPSQPFSNNDILHLMTVIEGFIIPPNTMPIPFDERAMSMLYRLFGIRHYDIPNGVDKNELTAYQIRRLASFERYETRASVRLRKAIKRLIEAIGRTD